jgi:iron complex outermembrane recepter protein
MRSEVKKLCLVPAALCAQLSFSALGLAAEPAAAPAASGGLDEIVVTAQRREERLQDVPMSITAFNQEKMDQQGIRSIDDLSRLSPGVTFFRNGMSSSGNYNDEGSDISIRAIDSTGGASTTGIYVDDTPIQTRHLQFGTVNPYPALFDLERVEVLKGPQGTLFGAGSEGGTLRFITPDPNLNHFEGFARSEFGQIDGGGQTYEGGVAVGGPLIEDVLGFRLSVSYRKDGGWVDRANYTTPPGTPVSGNFFPGVAVVYNGQAAYAGTTESNSNWRDTATGRLAVKWKASDDLSVMSSLYAQTLHINDTGAYWLNLSDPSNNTYRNGNIQRDPSTDPWYIGAIKVDWNTPFAHFVSNTSYFSRSQHSSSDYTQWFNTVFNGDQYDKSPVTSYFQDRQDNFQQEIRASSVDSSAALTWTAGLYYSHVDENTTEFIYLPVYPQNQLYNQPQFRIVDKQTAAFGELNYKFTDAWSLTAGMRYSRLSYTGTGQESGPLIGVVVNSTNSASVNPFTPRYVLNYKPTSDSLYYASAAKGFRPGGVNDQLPTACTSLLPTAPPTVFSSDTLWQYELGTKQEFFDHTLQVNAAAYYIQWKNIQQFVYLSCGLGFVPNLGNVDGKGGDIEVTWRATPDLTVGVTGAYTTAYYTGTESLANGSGSVVNLVTEGDHLLASPWNLSANAEYVYNAMEKKPYVRVDYQYTTAQNSLTPYLNPNNAPNSDPSLPGLPEIKVLSMRAGVRFDGLDLSVYALNLTNFHTPTFVSRDLATTTLNGYPYNWDSNYFGRGVQPLTYGVTATYRW